MSRAITDPSQAGDIASLSFRVRQLERRSSPAQYEIKVFGDAMDNETGNGAFIFAIPVELAGSTLFSAEAFVTTASGSGLPEIWVYNVTEGWDMLSTPITIEEGDYTSYSATVRSVVDPAAADVSLGDLISIDVTVAGSGAMGLGVILRFGE